MIDIIGYVKWKFSLLIGNLYIYFAWRGRDYVDTKMRTTVFTLFGVVAGVGALLVLTLNTKTHHSPTAGETANLKNRKLEEPENLKNANPANCCVIIVTIGNSIVDAFKLLVTKDMLLCMSLFMYSGLVVSFYTGVYPTAIGNSKTMPEQMGTVGLVGVFTGVGEVVGGGLFVFGSRLTNKVPRPILLIWYDIISITFIYFITISSCLIVHLIACFGMLINLPLQANMIVVEDGPCILGCILERPNQIIAFATAFLLGFGDAVLSNVIYTTITEVWSTNSAPAFAMYKVQYQYQR